MNKILKAFSLFVALGLAVSCAACDETPQPGPGPNPGTDPAEKALTYTGSTLAAATVGEAYSATVATATGATGISYALKSGSALPEGLKLAADGAISGTPTTAVAEASFTVTASASGYTSADATFKLTVEEGVDRITYNDFTADRGVAGAYYTAMLDKATGADNITYKVASDSSLPEGLTLLETGFIHGKVEQDGRQPFKVVASAEGYEDATASVLIIFGKSTAEGEGKISGHTNKTVTGAMVGKLYVGLPGEEGSFATATASNEASVTYRLADGETMPEGLELFPNGAVYGTPVKNGDTKVKITASAEGCAKEVTATITFKIVEPALPYDKTFTLEQAIVGTPYSASVKSTLAPEGLAITYKIAEGTFLPDGLTLSADGMIGGTPTASVKKRAFAVVASAEGYSDSTCNISIEVRDPEEVAQNGRLEAEYVNLIGKSGAGYSGAASDEQHVQASASASNGYFVGYTHQTGWNIEFKFKSSAAASGVKLEIQLLSELGAVTFTPKEFGILLNGKEVSYSSFAMEGTAGGWGAPKLFTVGNVDLNEGENSLVLIVRENTFMKGSSSGGPGIDFVQFTTTSTITWAPQKYNTNK